MSIPSSSMASQRVARFSGPLPKRLSAPEWPDDFVHLPGSLVVESGIETVVHDHLTSCRNELLAGRSVGVSLFSKRREGISGQSASNRYVSSLARLLPAEARQSTLRDWFYGLRKSADFDVACVFLNSPHKAPIFRRSILNLAGPLLESKAGGIGSYNTDMFFGDYDSTPFGVHKDLLHNCMFQLVGRRRILLWDEARLSELVEIGSDTDVFLDYSEFRDAAYIIDLNPGDFLFWPSRYWHVGECDGFSVSLNVDIGYRKAEFDRDLAESTAAVVTGALRQSVGRSKLRLSTDPSLAESELELAEREIDRILKDALEDRRSLRLSAALRLVASKSAGGFGRIRRQKLVETLNVFRVSPGQRVLLSTEGELVLGFGGRSLLLPGAQVVRDLLSHLRGDMRSSTGDLCIEFQGRPASDGSELDAGAVPVILEQLATIGLLVAEPES